MGAGCLAAALLAGCQITDGLLAGLRLRDRLGDNDAHLRRRPIGRIKGKELVGDVDGDGSPDRVTLRADAKRPARCRHVLVVEPAGGDTAAAPVKPLPWPGTNPKLLLLAEIDGNDGVEAVVTLSPANVFRPGAVFTLRQGDLARMRVERRYTPELFPFYDEFPAGVDCAGKPGSIVVTLGDIADGGKDDSHWDVTRSFYQAADHRFELVRRQAFRVEVGPEAKQRWPEVRGRPFLSCPDRVD